MPVVTTQGDAMPEVDFHPIEAGACAESRCPHCGAAEQDDYEVLETNDLHALRCGACGRRFTLLIAECPACAEESLITWRDEPSPEVLRYVRCLHCDAKWWPHGEDVRSLGDEDQA
jgi:Zn ribbon nucleic-acid-binding protein